MKNIVRCAWVNLKNEKYIKYHDYEWGIPLYDDDKLFELLLLESFQAGLSWECILNKRENFKLAFDGFGAEAIANYGEDKVNALLSDSGIIRNRRKIRAAIKNAKIFLEIQAEFGSFSDYIWSFSSKRIIFEEYQERTSSPLSDAISKDLALRGMSFVGTTIIYSYLQAIGIINGHSRACFCFKSE